MTNDEASAVLAAALHQIAPEVDLGAVDRDLPIQEVADIDSVHFLRLVTAIHERTGIEIPFRDYPKLSTLNMFVDYLTSASAASSATSIPAAGANGTGQSPEPGTHGGSSPPTSPSL